MKNALIFITLLNSILLMTCLTQADVNTLVTLELEEPKFFCGPQLTKAIKAFCRPGILEFLNRKSKKSLDFGYNNAIEPLAGYYEDDDFTGDDGAIGYEFVPNYYYSRLHKRDGPEHITITQACCKNPCTIKVLTEFCPRRH